MGHWRSLKAEKGLESRCLHHRAWASRGLWGAGPAGIPQIACLSSVFSPCPGCPVPPARASPPARSRSRGEGETLAGHLPFSGPGKGGCLGSHPPEGPEGPEPGGGNLWERARSPGALTRSWRLLAPERDVASPLSSPWEPGWSRIPSAGQAGRAGRGRTPLQAGGWRGQGQVGVRGFHAGPANRGPGHPEGSGTGTAHSSGPRPVLGPAPGSGWCPLWTRNSKGAGRDFCLSLWRALPAPHAQASSGRGAAGHI